MTRMRPNSEPCRKVNLVIVFHEYLTASLFTVEEDICGIKAIIASVCRGSDVCQR